MSTPEARHEGNGVDSAVLTGKVVTVTAAMLTAMGATQDATGRWILNQNISVDGFLRLGDDVLNDLVINGDVWLSQPFTMSANKVGFYVMPGFKYVIGSTNAAYNDWHQRVQDTVPVLNTKDANY